MSDSPDQRRAYLYALAAVLLWSTVASAFKLSLRYLDYAQLLFYACFVSVVVLGGITFAQGKGRQIFRGGLRAGLHSLLLGLLNPFFYYLILFNAYERLPAQEAQPLNYTWALTLTILSIPLLGQKPSRRDLAAGLICYSGVWVISTRGQVFSLQFSSSLGVLLALGSTVVWSLYWIYNTRDGRDPVVRLFLNFLLALPFACMYCLWQSSLWPQQTEALWGAVYIGVFEMGVSFVFWQQALRYSENAAKVGNLIFISPFISLVLINVFVGETILWSTVAGLILVVGGLLVQQLQRTSPK